MVTAIAQWRKMNYVVRVTNSAQRNRSQLGDGRMS